MTNKLIACYKCDSHKNLLVEEKKCLDADKVLEKNFICAKCAGAKAFEIE